MEELTAALPKIVSIFSLAFFSFWPAMPAGIALGLHPLVVIATTTLSYASGALLMLLLGDRLRAAWRRFRGRDAEPAETPLPAPDTLLRRAWRRFGAAGLGLLAPMTVGSQTGALVGMALNIRRWVILVWMVLGALVWSILLTIGALAGLVGLLGG